jgi:hypothetical protein
VVPSESKPVRLPSFDGSAAWWLNALAAFTRAVANRPADIVVRSASAAVSRLATAAKGYQDAAALEARIHELEEMANEMISAERHGTIAGTSQYGAEKPQRSAREARGAMGPEPSVH